LNENPTPNLIREKINELDYKSVNARFVLVKDYRWKVLICRFIFDIDDPHKHNTLLKKENFAIEDFSLSLEEFQKFLNYLKTVDIGSGVKIDSDSDITENMLFRLGNYKLCLAGNFPSRELEFYGRQIMLLHHGIQKPGYFTSYYIDSKIGAQLPRNLDLADCEIPFRDGVEAINHFWKTNFEHHQLNSRNCQFYMPTYSASLEKVSLDNTKFKIKFDIGSNTKKEDLSLSVIAKAQGNHRYNKKHNISSEKMEVDIRFTPNDASLYLVKKKKTIDEFNYYPPNQEMDFYEEQISGQKINNVQEVYENLKTFLEINHLQDPFYVKLIEQINKCYRYKMPDIALERIRKLFENLLIDILKKKYQNDVSSYQNLKKKHHQFHIIVENTKEKIKNGDFENVRSDFEEAINWVVKLRDKGSKSTHSITFDVKTKYLDEIHDEIVRKTELLQRIITLI